MTFYDYKAMDGKGKSSSGVIESGSTVGAINRIREMGLYPTSVTEKKKKAFGGKGGLGSTKKSGVGFFAQKVKTKEYVAFMRQFATLVDAGLPILRSLKVLAEQQTSPYFRKVLEDAGTSVESGNSLSDALKRYPNVFSDLFVNMVKAGEAGGVLDQVLLRMAGFYEKNAKLARKVKGSLAYPGFVVTIAGGIVYFLLAFVVPKFSKMFAGMGAELPGMTKILIGVSDFLKSHMILFIGILASLFIAIKMIFSTDSGRYYFDKFILKAPIAGDLAKKVSIARFSRTLGTLINSGVPILEALDITGKTVGNKIVAENIQMVNANIKEGESMVAPLRQGGVFPPVVLSMISVGEETGKISEMLAKVADAYDDEVDNTITAMTALIEPAIIVALAVGVGFIVIAMFLPLIGMIEQMTM
ncbi:MAG: type II secretion system F family protein [Candidatus Aureabacteria bacterium]|nr:type II secretion system F family protein [Candidatus Auribacterota bacterium]